MTKYITSSECAAHDSTAVCIWALARVRMVYNGNVSFEIVHKKKKTRRIMYFENYPSEWPGHLSKMSFRSLL